MRSHPTFVVDTRLGTAVEVADFAEALAAVGTYDPRTGEVTLRGFLPLRVRTYTDAWTHDEIMRDVVPHIFNHQSRYFIAENYAT